MILKTTNAEFTLQAIDKKCLENYISFVLC